MTMLRNSAVEAPLKTFEVELVVFGTMSRTATRRIIKVLAETVKGAKRICRQRYRRGEITRVREIPQLDWEEDPDMMNMNRVACKTCGAMLHSA